MEANALPAASAKRGPVDQPIYREPSGPSQKPEPSEPTGDPGLVLPAQAEEIVSMTPVGRPTPHHISPEAGVESQGLRQDTETGWKPTEPR